jgi:hypothetical protein
LYLDYLLSPNILSNTAADGFAMVVGDKQRHAVLVDRIGISHMLLEWVSSLRSWAKNRAGGEFCGPKQERGGTNKEYPKELKALTAGCLYMLGSPWINRGSL